VLAVLSNFVRHDIPYLLTSYHTDCRINTDAPTGGFRLLNLQLSPYGLGPTVLGIDDWIPGHARRHLALWRREQVVYAASVRKNGDLQATALGCRTDSDPAANSTT